MLAISGGTSPRTMFEIFAGTAFDWKRVHLFWVDERCVPPTDAQSNFKLADDTWLTPAKFPAANIHRVQTERDPEDAADIYVDELRLVFGEGIPKFTVIHRGMGPDAHTASLFPGEPLIDDRTGLAAPAFLRVEKLNSTSRSLCCPLSCWPLDIRLCWSLEPIRHSLFQTCSTALTIPNAFLAS